MKCNEWGLSFPAGAWPLSLQRTHKSPLKTTPHRVGLHFSLHYVVLNRFKMLGSSSALSTTRCRHKTSPPEVYKSVKKSIGVLNITTAWLSGLFSYAHCPLVSCCSLQRFCRPTSSSILLTRLRGSCMAKRRMSLLLRKKSSMKRKCSKWCCTMISSKPG